MRILGIDPGLRTTGFGVLDVEGPALRYVASGVIQTAQAGVDAEDSHDYANDSCWRLLCNVFNLKVT